MQNPQEVLLKSILSQPTAPFREGHVIRVILHELEKGGVPHFQDPSGNIIVGAKSRTDYAKILRTASAQEPVRLFIAHMDHPGFIGSQWLTPNRLKVQWHGGSPVEHLDGAAVWVANREDWLDEGHLSEVSLIESGKAIGEAVIQLSSDENSGQRPDSLFGGFRFQETHWEEDRIIYTKAADDLIGAFAICALALELRRSKRGPPWSAC